jgi:hypothetical protein
METVKIKPYLCIVPHLSPVVCGVSDYSQLLASELLPLGWRAEFAVPESRGDRAGSFHARVLHSEDVSGWKSVVSSYEKIVLMYSGYGFDKHGAPEWLADILQGYPGQLIVHFHEPYASSANPLSKTYWVAGKQRATAERLLRLSHTWITSNEGYAAMLRELNSETKERGRILKTPSNLGEPSQATISKSRTPLWIVAGTRGTRERTYRSLSGAPWLCSDGRVMDIGCERVPQKVLPDNAEVLGQLPVADFSKALLAAEAGLLTYQPRYLESSGVFAMYCAHGLTTLLWAREDLNEMDKEVLRKFAGFVTLVDKSIDVSAISSANGRALAWEYYQTCTLNDHASLYRGIFES